MYKWDVKDYSNSSSEQHKWAKELILKLNLKGNERVLDIGCGDGKVTAEIAHELENGSILGIDSSESMILFAQKAFSSTKFPNITFKNMDAKNLNFSSEFDIVFSNAVLHWVADHLSVLKGIKKSLKSNGRVLLQMGGRGNAADIFETLEKIIEDKKWDKYFVNFSFPYSFYGLEEYENWLESAALKANRLELIPKDMLHRGKEGLSAWFRTTGLPYTQRVPEEYRREFINTLVEKYSEKYPIDSDGCIHVRMIRLEVEAENT